MFNINDKVVCIWGGDWIEHDNTETPKPWPINNQIYVIEGFKVENRCKEFPNALCLILVGLQNEWYSDCFRKLEDIKEENKLREKRTQTEPIQKTTSIAA